MSDPVTRPAHEKRDEGKIRFELVDPTALQLIAEVFTKGAGKYADDGWKLVVATKEGRARYIGAMLRHTNAMQRGEIDDPESGLPHEAHIAANAIILCWERIGDDPRE